MLVLTRKVGQSTILELPDGQLIDFTPTQVKGNQVRIAIQAPREIPILREELVERKQGKV